MVFRSVAAAGLLLAASSLAAPACANEPTVVRVNTFPTARSLPFFAGLAKGIFARHGLKVEVVFTENSRQQREGLAAGKTDVVHAALDNAIAMIEVAKHDVVIVAGGDSGTNEFYVQPEIKSFAEQGLAMTKDKLGVVDKLVQQK